MTAIDEYIKDVFGSDANVVQVSELGHPTEELKGFGYGRPYQITFSIDGELKSVGSGHDNITHHNVYCAIVLLAQAKCLCTIGGSKNGKPVAFERPVQNVSKVLVVFDYQDGD